MSKWEVKHRNYRQYRTVHMCVTFSASVRTIFSASDIAAAKLKNARNTNKNNLSFDICYLHFLAFLNPTSHFRILSSVLCLLISVVCLLITAICSLPSVFCVLLSLVRQFPLNSDSDILAQSSYCSAFCQYQFFVCAIRGLLLIFRSSHHYQIISLSFQKCPLSN